MGPWRIFLGCCRILSDAKWSFWVAKGFLWSVQGILWGAERFWRALKKFLGKWINFLGAEGFVWVVAIHVGQETWQSLVFIVWWVDSLLVDQVCTLFIWKQLQPLLKGIPKCTVWSWLQKSCKFCVHVPLFGLFLHFGQTCWGRSSCMRNWTLSRCLIIETIIVALLQ